MPPLDSLLSTRFTIKPQLVRAPLSAPIFLYLARSIFFFFFPSISSSSSSPLPPCPCFILPNHRPTSPSFVQPPRTLASASPSLVFLLSPRGSCSVLVSLPLLPSTTINHHTAAHIHNKTAAQRRINKSSRPAAPPCWRAAPYPSSPPHPSSFGSAATTRHRGDALITLNPPPPLPLPGPVCAAVRALPPTPTPPPSTPPRLTAASCASPRRARGARPPPP